MEGNMKKPLLLALKCPWSLGGVAEEERGLSDCPPPPEQDSQPAWLTGGCQFA